MAITFACPICNTVYTVADADAGKKDQCKKCGQRLQVPAPPRAKTILGEIVQPGTSGPELPEAAHWAKVDLSPTAPPPLPAKPPAPSPLQASQLNWYRGLPPTSLAAWLCGASAGASAILATLALQRS